MTSIRQCGTLCRSCTGWSFSRGSSMVLYGIFKINRRAVRALGLSKKKLSDCPRRKLSESSRKAIGLSTKSNRIAHEKHSESPRKALRLSTKSTRIAHEKRKAEVFPRMQPVTRRVAKHPDFELQAMHPGRGTGRNPVGMTKWLRAIHRARHGFINDS